jgi:hypothetical protein
MIRRRLDRSGASRPAGHPGGKPFSQEQRESAVAAPLHLSLSLLAPPLGFETLS